LSSGACGPENQPTTNTADANTFKNRSDSKSPETICWAGFVPTYVSLSYKSGNRYRTLNRKTLVMQFDTLNFVEGFCG
jgi:hypothetical protein